jgi:chemotaxis protein MotB
MADAKKQTIIIKKIIAGGHGHHGGAWKVAYADFVTAMMAFFLVMWLMGTDEETKEAIAHYFNHPNTPYQQGKDPESKTVHPMGERNGDGESVLQGMEGLAPEDMIANPVRSESYVEKYKQMGELVREIMEGQAFDIEVEIEYFKFSVPESAIFIPGTSQVSAQAKERLDRIGRIFKNFKGYVTIQDYTDTLVLDKYKRSSVYESSIVRAVAVMNYFVNHNFMSEEKLHPLGGGRDQKYVDDFDPQGYNKRRRVEFSLKQYKSF